MDEPQAAEREQFETWCESRRFSTERYGLGYHDTKTNRAWLAWEVRAALSTAPVQGVLTDEQIKHIGQTLGKRVPGVSDYTSWPGMGYELDESGEYRVPGFPNVAYEFARAIERAALASAPHPPSNTLGDALTGPGDPVASLPAPPIAAGEVRSVE